MDALCTRKEPLVKTDVRMSYRLHECAWRLGERADGVAAKRIPRAIPETIKCTTQSQRLTRPASSFHCDNKPKQPAKYCKQY